MAEEYCKYHLADEDYCYTLLVYECVDTVMKSKECRPASNPFNHTRGKKVVSVCLDEKVLKKYQDIVTDSVSSSKKSSGSSSSSNKYSAEPAKASPSLDL